MDEQEQLGMSERLGRINAKLDLLSDKMTSIEKSTYENQEAVARLEERLHQIEQSFVDELAKTAKDKFDTFREYLASKIRP